MVIIFKIQLFIASCETSYYYCNWRIEKTKAPARQHVRDGQLELSEYSLFLSGIHDGDKFYCFSKYKDQLGYSRLDKNTLKVEAFWPDPFAPNGIDFVVGDKFVSVERAFITLNSFSDGSELARYEPTSLLDTAKASPYGKLVSHKGQVYFYVNNNPCY